MKRTIIADRIILYLILVFFALIFLYPFIWMLYTSFKSDTEILDPNPLSFPSVKYFHGKNNAKEVFPLKKIMYVDTGELGHVDPKRLEKKKNVTFFEGSRVKILRFAKNDIIPVSVQKDTGQFETQEIRYGDMKKRIFLFENYIKTWKQGRYFNYYLFNSFFTSILSTLLQLWLAAFAAFAFARLKFKLNELFFSLFLATMMIPSQMLLIPHYIIVVKLGMYNTYWGIILPGLANVANIFLLRQFFKSLPNDLFDSVTIDGGSIWHTFLHIALPLSKPILFTTALFSFIFQWNSFIWILIVTNDPKMQTLQVGLSNFSQSFGTDWNLLMAASTIVILPLIVLYFFVQKRIIESLSRSGIKG